MAFLLRANRTSGLFFRLPPIFAPSYRSFATKTKPAAVALKAKPTKSKQSIEKEFRKPMPRTTEKKIVKEKPPLKKKSPANEEPQTKEGEEEGHRLTKMLARGGIASRRQSEEIIASGRVTVDGKVVTSNVPVSTDNVIKIDGKPLELQPTRIFLHYKKRGVLITHAKDPDGKLTLFAQLKKMGLEERLISVGRLDYNTEGLLLLTNSGTLARHLELPANKYERRYLVEVYGRLTPKKIIALNRKVYINGTSYEGTAKSTGNSWLQITLRDGKNRHIRKVLKELHLEVKSLVRTHYGPYSLDGLHSGDVKEVALKGDLVKFRYLL